MWRAGLLLATLTVPPDVVHPVSDRSEGAVAPLADGLGRGEEAVSTEDVQRTTAGSTRQARRLLARAMMEALAEVPVSPYSW
jgi:hypothetical protein